MTGWFCGECGPIPDVRGLGEPCPRHPERVLVGMADRARYQVDRLLGRRLAGRYALFRFLGEGGFGATYQARDDALQRLVAVKILKPGGRLEDLDRFRLEARTLARLEHPAIVGIHDLGEDQGTPFLVMAWIDGYTLPASGGRDWRPQLTVLLDVLDGLAAAHDARIVHRDLKPLNIMVTHGSPARGILIDFGIAKTPDAEALTATGKMVGTMRFMAPESVHGGASSRLDVYAMGVIIADVFADPSGRIFAETNPAEHFRQKAGGPPALASSMPKPIAAVARACLQVDPDRRYADAGALADALRQALVDLEAETAILPAIEPLPPPAPDPPEVDVAVRRGSPILLALGLLAVAAGAGVVGYLVGRDAPVAVVRATPMVVAVGQKDAGIGQPPARQPTQPAVAPLDAAPPVVPPPDAAPPDAARPDATLPDAAPPDAAPPDAARPAPRTAPPPARRRMLKSADRKLIIRLVQACDCGHALGLVARLASTIDNGPDWTDWVAACHPRHTDGTCRPLGRAPPRR